MRLNLTEGIVRILTPNDGTAGTGFVVSDDGIIVTCADVVSEAKAGPGDTVSLIFCASRTKEKRNAIVEPDWWRSSDTQDVAFLRLEGSLPEEVLPLPLGSSLKSAGHTFSTLGFPELNPIEGMRDAGEVLGQKRQGGIPVLQLRSEEVTHGLSGAPVWDDALQLVIGMINSSITKRELKIEKQIFNTPSDSNLRFLFTAFATPTETLGEICPILQISIATRPSPLFPHTLLDTPNLHIPLAMLGHLFISYARNDGEAFARRLHDDLESKHLKAWLDIYDIPKGTDWDAEIDKALQSARAVVVALTPGAVLSLQVKSEWNDALNRYLPIIPLFVRNCNVPRILKVFNYIDFQDDYDGGFAALCQRLRNLDYDHLEQLKISLLALEVAQREALEPLRFQAKIDDLRSIIESWGRRVEIQGKRIADGLDELHQQLSIPPTRQVIIVGERPPNVTDHFKNRVGELNDIRQMLVQPSTRIVSLIGHSGIGKTALASRVLDDLEFNSWSDTNDNIPVNGFVCLNARPTGITLERMFFACSKLLGGEHEKTLNAVWINPEMQTGDKVRFLLEALKEGQYVIFLDNMEELLDDEGRVIDEDLRTFFENSLMTTGTARLLITSRIRLAFRQDMMRFDQQVSLDKGLPIEEGVAFLRELDPNGICGLRDAPKEQLIKVVKSTHGVPRALQMIAALLDSDPFSNLNDILGQFLHYKKVVQELIEEGYRRLDNNARRVMEALAVFGRPVPTLAVDYLLGPFLAGLDVPSVLRRLTLTRMVSVDRTTKMVLLHPIDQDYAYSQLPEGEAGDSTYSRQALERQAARYYAGLRTPPDTWRTSYDLEPQRAEFEHWIKAGDLREALGVVQRIKVHLFRWGLHEELTRMLKETESAVQELVREQVGYKSVIVFVGTGDLALNIMREFQAKETVTLALDKVAIGWAYADFQIVLGGEELRDTARIVSLLQSFIPANIRELPYPPVLLTYYSSFDSETVFQTAAQLGYKVIPNEKAAIMATNKLKFWEQVKDVTDIRPYVLPRKPLFLPQSIVSRVRKGVRDALTNQFLTKTLADVRAIGLPCVMKPIITENAYGQCIVSEDSEEALWDALWFAIKETDNRKTNPGYGFLLEKAVEKPFIELTQGVIRYRDNAGQLRTICLLPILAERKNRSDIGHDTQRLVRGPFIFYSAFHTHREEDWPEQVRKNKVRMQEISSKLVDLSGGDEGVYGIGFFLKDDHIWIGDHFVVKPDDKMLVTKITHKLNASKLLANVIEGIPMSEADILEVKNIGGARTILWQGNEEAELKAVEGTELVIHDYVTTSVEIYSEKKQMWPLRIMGLILAQAPPDVALDEIRKVLDATETQITLVPRKSEQLN